MNQYNNHGQPFQHGGAPPNQPAYYYSPQQQQQQQQQHHHQHHEQRHFQQQQEQHQPYQYPQQHYPPQPLGHEIHHGMHQQMYRHPHIQEYRQPSPQQSQYLNNPQAYHENSATPPQPQHSYTPHQQAHRTPQIPPQQNYTQPSPQYLNPSHQPRENNHSPQPWVQIYEQPQRQHAPAYQDPRNYQQTYDTNNFSHLQQYQPNPNNQAERERHESTPRNFHTPPAREHSNVDTTQQDELMISGEKGLPSGQHYPNSNQSPPQAVSELGPSVEQREAPKAEASPHFHQPAPPPSRDPPQLYLTQDDLLNITKSPLLDIPRLDPKPVTPQPPKSIDGSTPNQNESVLPKSEGNPKATENTVRPQESSLSSPTLSKTAKPKPSPQKSSRLSNGPSVYVQVPQLPPQDLSETEPFDYQVMLLSLANQYICEARAIAPLIYLQKGTASETEYFQLMALSLSCVERVLNEKSWSLPPRQEAALRLHYANLLFQETDNFAEIEALLSKGISFCDTNRMHDFKYAMQHLLVRVLFLSKTRAALKTLDTTLSEAISLNHTPWIYVFRFLRITLSQQLRTAHERSTTFQNIRAIADLSRANNDGSILALSAILEAVMHLQAGQADSVLEAQRAIAIARAQNSNGTSSNIPQISAMIIQIDLLCSLDPYSPSTTREKLDALTKGLEGFLKSWRDDGSFSLPLNDQSSKTLVSDSGGIFVKDLKGLISLSFNWLGKTEVHVLAYYLSALTTYYKNASNHKTEDFLVEGLKMTEESYQNLEAYEKDSSKRISSRLSWLRTMRCYMLLTLAFAQCERSDWHASQATIEKLRDESEAAFETLPKDLDCLITYLSGTVYQASGDLTQALQIYLQDNMLMPEPGKNFPSHVQETLNILSSLNTLLIIRPETHSSHHLLAPLFSRLESYFESDAITSSAKSNPHIQAFYHLILATINQPLKSQQTHSPAISTASITGSPSQGHSSNSIIQFKTHLQKALHLSKSVHNSHLLTICLAQMHASFFEGIVGQQAVNAANAARATAKDAGSKLWTVVADGLGAETLTREGRVVEAEELWKEGDRLFAQLGPNFSSGSRV